MPESKLYQLLAQLEGGELSWLDKFIASPYFNANEQLQQLWRILRDAHPHYEGLDKEAVFRALCPGQDYAPPFVNARYSELSRLVEQFFFQQEFRREEALQQPVRRAAYRSRKLYRQFTRECRRQISSLQGQNCDAQSLGSLLNIYGELYGHPEAISHGDGKEEARQAMEYLDRHFIILKLRYFADLQSRQSIYEEKHAVRFKEAVLAEAAGMQEGQAVIGLYYRLARIFQDGFTEEGLRELWALFQQHGQQLPQPEQGFFVNKLTILAYLRLNQGETAYQALLVDLFKYGDEHRLFIVDGQISDASFLNICTVGAAAGEFNWVLRFIDSHKGYLPASSAGQAYILGKAAVFFNQADYQGAHRLLREVKKKQTPFQLRMHSLSVRCLLGMHLEDPDKYYPTLSNSVEAFSRFIRRNNGLSASRKQGYLNFSKAVRRIAALRSENWNSTRARSALLQWMEKLSPLMLRPWLEEQLHSKAKAGA